MKKVLGIFVMVITIITLVVLATLLTLRIKNDTLNIKSKTELEINTKREVDEYIKDTAKIISDIKRAIEIDIGQDIEIADTGSIGKLELFFVTKVDDQYKYITKKVDESNEKFYIASEDDGKYIISEELLKIDNLVYTKIEDYVIDKTGNITYLL